MLKTPSKEEVFETLKNSNFHAAPGCDGITSYFYYKMFDEIGEILTEVIQAIFQTKILS